VVVPLNVLLLPFVAVYPPLCDHVLAVIDTWGTHGVDPRTTPLEPAGKRGYSPTLKLWWRSIFLIHVPAFKYFCAQGASVALLFLLTYVAPCLDFNNHDACFAGGGAGGADHVVGHRDAIARFVGWDEEAPSDDVPLYGEVGNALAAGSAINGGPEAPASLMAALPSRRLRGSGGTVHKVDKGTEHSGDSHLLHHSALPTLNGFSKDSVLLLFLLYLIAVIVHTLGRRLSMANSSTLVSAFASCLALGFLALDVSVLYVVNINTGMQPMLLGTAAFFLSFDIARAIMLKTFICGPSVLMLFLMMRDVRPNLACNAEAPVAHMRMHARCALATAVPCTCTPVHTHAAASYSQVFIFLILATAIALSFAFALFFNAQVGAATNARALSARRAPLLPPAAG
jgi:hypothetical protein